MTFIFPGQWSWIIADNSSEKNFTFKTVLLTWCQMWDVLSRTEPKIRSEAHLDLFAHLAVVPVCFPFCKFPLSDFCCSSSSPRSEKTSNSIIYICICRDTYVCVSFEEIQIDVFFAEIEPKKNIYGKDPLNRYTTKRKISLKEYNCKISIEQEFSIEQCWRLKVDQDISFWQRQSHMVLIKTVPRSTCTMRWEENPSCPSPSLFFPAVHVFPCPRTACLWCALIPTSVSVILIHKLMREEKAVACTEFQQ